MSRHSLRGRRWQKTATLVKDRDGNVCTRCGATDDLTVDHIVPMVQLIADGHTEQAYDPDWLTTLCRRCNSSKNDGIDGRSNLIHPDYADTLQLGATGFF